MVSTLHRNRGNGFKMLPRCKGACAAIPGGGFKELPRCKGACRPAHPLITFVTHHAFSCPFSLPGGSVKELPRRKGACRQLLDRDPTGNGALGNF